MKKIIEEVSGEGLESLLGERVTLFCMNYFYTGVLKGVNDSCVLLSDASIVFDTGSFDNDQWQDAQKLPNDWYVNIQSIEAFGVLK